MTASGYFNGIFPLENLFAHQRGFNGGKFTQNPCSKVIDPDADTAPFTVIATIVAIVGATVAVVVIPLGIMILGSITDGLAVIGVADMIVLAAIAGLVAGGTVVWISYVLARQPHHAEDPELLAA